MTLAVGKDSQYGGKVLFHLSGEVEFLPRNSLLTFWGMLPIRTGRFWTELDVQERQPKRHIQLDASGHTHTLVSRVFQASLSLQHDKTSGPPP